MRRGYYFAHELEAAVQRYLRHHRIPPSERAAVSSRLVFLNWQAAREETAKKKITGIPTNDVETSDKGGAGKDVS